MRLRSLEVEHFRAIQSARLVFGPGLNVVHGPNDLGKSTLTEAIRAVLLIAPGSAEARSFATWGATPDGFPDPHLLRVPGGRSKRCLAREAEPKHTFRNRLMEAPATTCMPKGGTSKENYASY